MKLLLIVDSISHRKLSQIMKKKAFRSLLLLHTNSTMPDDTSTTTTIPQDIKQILHEFANAFKESDKLPPKRKVDHAIALMDEKQIVS